MNALAVLYGGSLAQEAFENIFAGKNAVNLALEKAARFPGVTGIVLLLSGALPDGFRPEAESAGAVPVKLVYQDSWTRKSLLKTISASAESYDQTYFAWADCPLLDPALAGRILDRHVKYAAEYSYADGWPYGLAPELLAPGTAGILAKILGDGGGEPVERNAVFSVLQKDINAFDIETEISPIDLRSHRLSLCADSKRNLLLLSRFFEAFNAEAHPLSADGASPSVAGISALTEKIITERPGLLRTLPAFYPVQVAGPCLQACTFCPYPVFGAVNGVPVTERTDFMDPLHFSALLDSIVAFSGDAVIDLSLWGEISLHPQKTELIRQALARPELCLIIETSGLGWKNAELEEIVTMAAAAPKRKNPLLPRSPLSWIVSLDAFDSGLYREIRGAGFSEAVETAKKLLTLFPGNTYVQAVRTAGAEDDIEKFYRFWKDESVKAESVNENSVIIQKYDDFCGFLPKKQASDLSPVRRQSCWHLMREIPVLIDGTVPLCRETLGGTWAGTSPAGNAFTESLELIWERQGNFYRNCCGDYPPICAECDEYYTYNF
ncbi:spiro-SPASM protein [Spirochaetia bacterium]|nr:spiro-SPASM protein [Spirochaetia bacterium]